MTEDVLPAVEHAASFLRVQLIDEVCGEVFIAVLVSVKHQKLPDRSSTIGSSRSTESGCHIIAIQAQAAALSHNVTYAVSNITPVLFSRPPSCWETWKERDAAEHGKSA